MKELLMISLIIFIILTTLGLIVPEIFGPFVTRRKILRFFGMIFFLILVIHAILFLDGIFFGGIVIGIFSFLLGFVVGGKYILHRVQEQRKYGRLDEWLGWIRADDFNIFEWYTKWKQRRDR